MSRMDQVTSKPIQSLPKVAAELNSAISSDTIKLYCLYTLCLFVPVVYWVYQSGHSGPTSKQQWFGQEAVNKCFDKQFGGTFLYWVCG